MKFFKPNRVLEIRDALGALFYELESLKIGFVSQEVTLAKIFMSEEIPRFTSKEAILYNIHRHVFELMQNIYYHIEQQPKTAENVSLWNKIKNIFRKFFGKIAELPLDDKKDIIKKSFERTNVCDKCFEFVDKKYDFVIPTFQIR